MALRSLNAPYQVVPCYQVRKSLVVLYKGMVPYVESEGKIASVIWLLANGLVLKICDIDLWRSIQCQMHMRSFSIGSSNVNQGVLQSYHVKN